MAQSATAHRLQKVLYMAMVQTVGGRDHGTSRSSDGNLDIRLIVLNLN